MFQIDFLPPWQLSFDSSVGSKIHSLHAEHATTTIAESRIGEGCAESTMKNLPFPYLSLLTANDQESVNT